MNNAEAMVLLHDIEDSDHEGTDWERDFLESIDTQLCKGVDLSEKQAIVLRRIHTKAIGDNESITGAEDEHY